MRSLLQQEGREVRFVGREDDAAYKAFFYVLLLMGGEERRSYPHLNTLIREQFYKPNIFDCDAARANRQEAQQMLQKCLGYFEEVGDGTRA
jgi:hypothetical protein